MGKKNKRRNTMSKKIGDTKPKDNRTLATTVAAANKNNDKSPAVVVGAAAGRRGSNDRSQKFVFPAETISTNKEAKESNLLTLERHHIETPAVTDLHGLVWFPVNINHHYNGATTAGNNKGEHLPCLGAPPSCIESPGFENPIDKVKESTYPALPYA